MILIDPNGSRAHETIYEFIVDGIDSKVTLTSVLRFRAHWTRCPNCESFSRNMAMCVSGGADASGVAFSSAHHYAHRSIRWIIQ